MLRNHAPSPRHYSSRAAAGLLSQPRRTLAANAQAISQPMEDDRDEQHSTDESAAAASAAICKRTTEILLRKIGDIATALPLIASAADNLMESIGT